MLAKKKPPGAQQAKQQTRLGADHIDVANTLFITAVLLDDVKKYEFGLVAYKEAYRIQKLVLGELERHEEAQNLRVKKMISTQSILMTLCCLSPILIQ